MTDGEVLVEILAWLGRGARREMVIRWCEGVRYLCVSFEPHGWPGETLRVQRRYSGDLCATDLESAWDQAKAWLIKEGAV